MAGALLLGGCGATQTGFAVEGGQPAFTWRRPGTVTTRAADADDGARTAEANLRRAEQAVDDPMALAEANFELAVERRREGDVAEAERLYREALAICEREKGPDHPDVATAQNALGTLLASRGRDQEARPLLERALEIRRGALGDDSEVTAQSMNNLALLLAVQGDVAAAEPLYLEAIAVLEQKDRSSGALDQVLDNYAALLRDTGRDQEAGEVEVRAGAVRAARQKRLAPSE